MIPYAIVLVGEWKHNPCNVLSQASVQSRRLMVVAAVVQSLSCAPLFATPWTAARQTPLSSISWSLLKLRSIDLVR